MQKISFKDKFGLTDLVLSGQKTQTRDVIKIQDERINYLRGWNLDYEFAEFGRERETPLRLCPKYYVGEMVAVAMSYKSIYERVAKTWEYAEEYKREHENLAGWKNKMFVRPELMPHTIKITNVRIERLQDINDEDCLAEGIEKMIVGCVYYCYSFLSPNPNKIWEDFKSPRQAYATLIDKVNGKGTWASNPYVWVYDFELVK